jgi:hypothetical protein
MKKLILSLALIYNAGVIAQTQEATLYLNDASGTGIQSFDNTASGSYSVALGTSSVARRIGSTAIGSNNTAFSDGATAIGSANQALGNNSTAIGNNCEAGPNSTAIGSSVRALGFVSTAFGSNSEASGDKSVAIGENNVASGERSTAFGSDTDATGWYSTSFGRLTLSSGKSATAMGESTNATGQYSLSSGYLSSSNGDFSTAFGSVVNSNGKFSFAAGRRLTVTGYAASAFGVYNLPDEEATDDTFSYSNTAFVIGNGPDGNNRSNAFKVLFDGTTTIAGELNINSDMRLKANIISLGSTLSKLLQIDGKTYTMKKDTNHKKKIGLLAQDIEKVFPELVSETNDIKSVNYQGLVPVLINAMKEQDEVIKQQDVVNSQQQKEIDELKALVNELIESR